MSKLTRRTFIAASLASAGWGAWSSVAGAQGASPLTQPGMRLLWLGAAASVPGERSQIVPAPNGTWINRRTGQHYREFETPGPGGAGYTVADVHGSAGNSVLAWLTSMLIHVDQGNATSFIDANGSFSTAQNIGDFWMPPAQLATFTDRNDAGVRMMRVPYALGGRTYRALRIQTEVSGGWAQNTYDLDTGLLLVGSSTGQGSPTVVLGPGNTIASGAGSTQMTFTQLAGSRQTNLPGPGMVYPNALRQLRTLTYSGSRGFLLPGSQVPATPLQIRYDIVSNAGSHLNARMTVTSAVGASDVRNRVFPAGVVGSLWMNPGLLGRYGVNQLLDQDPVANVQTISLGRQGNVALVALQTRLARQTFGYDLRSGLLTQAEQRQQIGPSTDVLSVQMVRTE
jgi:hypothetical protein